MYIHTRRTLFAFANELPVDALCVTILAVPPDVFVLFFYHHNVLQVLIGIIYSVLHLSHLILASSMNVVSQTVIVTNPAPFATEFKHVFWTILALVALGPCSALFLVVRATNLA